VHDESDGIGNGQHPNPTVQTFIPH
jgi:hypothetical protein